MNMMNASSSKYLDYEEKHMLGFHKFVSESMPMPLESLQKMIELMLV